VVEWEGDEAPVRDLALARKDDLVLKRGTSRQGMHVVVGRCLSDSECAAAVECAGRKASWLVQQYCQSDRLYAPDGRGVTEHDAVCGVFGLGREYGGAFVRLMDSTVSRGEVNAARGEKEGAVLEVVARKKRFTLRTPQQPSGPQVDGGQHLVVS
jgi:hypothetical protein